LTITDGRIYVDGIELDDLDSDDSMAIREMNRRMGEAGREMGRIGRQMGMQIGRQMGRSGNVSVRRSNISSSVINGVTINGINGRSTVMENGQVRSMTPEEEVDFSSDMEQLNRDMEDMGNEMEGINMPISYRDYSDQGTRK